NESTSGYITNEGRAVAVDKKGFYRAFIIRVVKDTSDEFLFKRVEAEGSEYELIDEWLHKYEQVSTNLKTALGAILAPTRFEVGQIDDPYSVKPVKLKHMSVRQAVNELIKQFGGEVRYRVLMQNNRVIKRYVDVLKRRGTNTGRRFETGKDIIKVSRTLDSTQIKTALYGIGASDEHGNRLTFRDVVWEKAKGDPVDK